MAFQMSHESLPLPPGQRLDVRHTQGHFKATVSWTWELGVGRVVQSNLKPMTWLAEAEEPT